jgi:hypothetical protein
MAYLKSPFEIESDAITASKKASERLEAAHNAACAAEGTEREAALDSEREIARQDYWRAARELQLAARRAGDYAAYLAARDRADARKAARARAQQ